MSNEQNIYENVSEGFVLVPAAGVRLNSKVFIRPCLCDGINANKLNDLLCYASSFNEVSRFNCIHQNTIKSATFIKEYFDSYKEDNSYEQVFINKDKVNIPYVKSIHSILASSLKSSDWKKAEGNFK